MTTRYDFSAELSLIADEHLRSLVHDYMMEAVPSYFWEIGASSSGKYHPCFSQGEGGLVRHTRAVVMFLDELMRMSGNAYMKQSYKDFAYAAAIMHDTCKYGAREYDKTQYKAHDVVAADHFAEYCAERGEVAPELLLMAMRSHMGQWASDPSCKPFTNIDRVVHMADYMASRSFIDIPSLHEVEG